jgi:hypothetical protein
MSTTLETLQEAAVVLSQAGSVKERLAQAWLSHLFVIETSQLPENFRGDFREMSDAMRRERALPRENPVLASIRKMSNEEASRYTALVIRLYAAVARGGLSAPLPRPPVLAPIVQLFAADA